MLLKTIVFISYGCVIKNKIKPVEYKIKNMKTYLIVSLFISLAFVAQSIDYCQGCVTTNFTYTCNGKNCEGFQFTTATTHPIIQGIECKSGKSPCYVRDRYDNATSTEYWIACNSSLSSCGSCFEKADCATCYAGFHLYNYDIENEKHNCRACSDSISGCLKCSNGQVCQLCEDPYRLMLDGLCHNKDGTLVDG
jgi:hypothetical protein